MNNEQLMEFFDDLFDECRSTLSTAAREYAEMEGRFSNFERSALALKRNPRLLHITRGDVARVFLQKHIDSIMGGVSIREAMRGRIIDAINYLILLGAMESEEANSHQQASNRQEPEHGQDGTSNHGEDIQGESIRGPSANRRSEHDNIRPGQAPGVWGKSLD